MELEYKRLNGNLDYGDTVCGFVLQIIQNNEKISVVKNLYMCGLIIERKILDFENEQLAKNYCVSYVKDWDNYVKGENKQKKERSLFD